MRLVFVFLLAVFAHAGPVSAQSCNSRDFIDMPLPANASGPLWMTAILWAYPDLHSGTTPSTLEATKGEQFAAQGPTGRAMDEIISNPTLGDQFAAIYPLSRDLDARLAPYQDPGRARNGAFFSLLYGADAAAIENDLVTVTAGPQGRARFRFTRRHGVSCQLQAAFSMLLQDWDEFAPFFSQPGGGYNWRRIAGTNRLSPHAFGIAIDINAELGGYWRWTGAREGHVGDFDNKVPWRLIEIMERHGFIWGGKWHHFDGMHFEYRPELILYSRIMDTQRSTGDTQ